MNPAHSQTLAAALFTDSLHDHKYSLSSATFFFNLQYDIFNAKLYQFATEDS